MNDRSDNPKRIYRIIAADLAAKIHDGEFADGSLLPSERELSETFGASRTSVREALLSLQASGLIAIRQKARARVTKVSNPVLFDQLSNSARGLLSQPSGIADFQEARMLFECGLARYAARHASPKEIDRLGIALAQNQKAIGKPALFAKTDRAFHDVLAEIPRNPIFTALNSALSVWLHEQRSVSIRAPRRGLTRLAHEGHRAIYEAIAKHDVAAADKAMTDHLKTFIKFYWQAAATKTKRPRAK